MVWIEFILGLIFLVVGADFLVRGASRFAEDIGVSHLVVGLTVVAYGTSTPELAVSSSASIHGQGGIAVGNVVGSNIFNVLFIVGLIAMIKPLPVARRIAVTDMPLLIVVSIVLLLMGVGLHYGRLDGFFLFGGILCYTFGLIYFDRKKIKKEKAQLAVEGVHSHIKLKSTLINLALIAAGLFFLVRGAQWFVDGAVAFAELFKVDPLVIGLTVVGAGTSLPELVTSIVAVLRNEKDIVIGNVIGSNLFNIMAVLGFSALVAPDAIMIKPSLNSFDMVVMIMALVICLPIFFTTRILSKSFGAYLLLIYVVYTSYLVHLAVNMLPAPSFLQSFTAIVVPLTLIAVIHYLVIRWRQSN